MACKLRFLIRPAWLPMLLLLLGAAPQACAYDVLCREGNAGFATHFPAVGVDVGPPVNDKFAARTCRAILSWDDQELRVASDAAEIDLDIFGAGLQPGHPMAAFQIKKNATE